MSIVVRTNLFSERLEQEAAKRPRRILAAAIVGIILSAVGGFLLVQAQVKSLRIQEAATRARETALDQELGRSRTAAAEREQAMRHRDAVLQIAQRHRHWAPVLERLFAATPGNVEITSLHINAVDRDEGVVRIVGRAAGPEPRLICDKCRLLFTSALFEIAGSVHADFTRLEESASTIHFEEKDYPAADFTIELKIKNARPYTRKG